MFIKKIVFIFCASSFLWVVNAMDTPNISSFIKNNTKAKKSARLWHQIYAIMSLASSETKNLVAEFATIAEPIQEVRGLNFTLAYCAMPLLDYASYWFKAQSIKQDAEYVRLYTRQNQRLKAAHNRKRKICKDIANLSIPRTINEGKEYI